MNSKEMKSDAVLAWVCGYAGMLPTLNIIYCQIILGEAKISSTFRGPDSPIVSQINREFHKIKLDDWGELRWMSL